MTQNRTFLGMLVLTVIAAGLAGWLGVRHGLDQAPTDLDRLLHQQLDLTPEQERKLEALEKKMTANRHRLRDEMKKSNRELAEALGRDHNYGPAEKAAVERFHGAMVELQEDTIRHVMAMRAVLAPDQARRFDEIVTKKLVDDRP
jgi:Spy/CpxP family protein refolding chaperone